MRNCDANSAVAAVSNCESAPDAYPAEVAAAPALCAAAAASSAAWSIAGHSVWSGPAAHCADRAPSEAASAPAWVADVIVWAAASVEYPLTAAGTTPFAASVSAPAFTPAASCDAPDEALRIPPAIVSSPVPSCPAPSASDVAPEPSCVEPSASAVAPAAAWVAPSASWCAPEAASPSWSPSVVNPRKTFSRYTCESCCPRIDAAAEVTCAVIASSTTFESGGVLTSMVACSGVPPGAVEVAAAEKFDGIVTTAW